MVRWSGPRRAQGRAPWPAVRARNKHVSNLAWVIWGRLYRFEASRCTITTLGARDVAASPRRVGICRYSGKLPPTIPLASDLSIL